MPTDNSTSEEVARKGDLYRFLWRWHLYAGLIVAPFLIILAITGALYIFPDEIEGMAYGDMFHASGGKALPVEAQEAAVRAHHPDAVITRYALPNTPDRPAEISFNLPDGKALTAFVDPATAAYKGETPMSSRLMTIVSHIHGELLAGPIGDNIVELAASWSFILLVTGAFLWWPRKERNYGTFKPNLAANPRKIWRELHSVLSLYHAPIIAFLILTGLPWAGFWGIQLANLGTIIPAAAPSPNFHSAPPLTVIDATADIDPHAAHRLKNDKDIPWAVRMAPQPHVESHAGTSLPHLMHIASIHGVDKPGLRLILPQGDNEPVIMSFVPEKAEGQRTIYVHPNTGAVIQNIGWQDYSPLAKAVEFGVMVHLGKQFGLINKLVLVIACLGLVATIVFGVLSWWKRRPKGKTGAPPVPDSYVPATGVLVAAALLGLLFPLAGLSMIVIVAAEVCWFQYRKYHRRNT